MRTWVAGMLAGLSLVGAARAQAPDEVELIPVDAGGPPSVQGRPAAAGSALEEVVVTAQKRSESLQDTPISMVALGTEALQVRGIDSIDDLQGNVPGINIEPFPTQSSSLRLFIRGVGLNESQVTQDPAVGVYQDGVYIARSTGLALEVADLERIEVLRGPQGTLYGRNTTGGAINLITRRPDPDAFSMRHSFSAGNYGLASLKSTVNLPLGRQAAVKLAALFKRQDGFVDNTGPGGDFGDRESKGLRLDARWLPGDRLTVDYSFDFTDTRSYAPLTQPVLPPESDKGGSELIKAYGQLNSVYSSERLEALATGMPLEASGSRISGHALTLALALDRAELKYIGAYRRLDDDYYTDLGGGAGSVEFRLDTHRYEGPAATVAHGGPVPLAVPRVAQSQWSHELQLSGRLFDERVQYIAGLFWFSEDASDRTPYSHQASSAVAPAQLGPLYQAFPEIFNGVLTLAGPRLVVFNERDYGAANEASAVFAQASWTPDAFDGRLQLTLGYRHSEDERKAYKTYVQDSYLEAEINGLGAALPLQSAESFDRVQASNRFQDDSFSYLAGFDVSDDVHIYAKYVEGYRSGGFDLRDPQVSSESGAASDGTDYGFGFVDGFAPEQLASSEIGIKSEWFGRRLRLNADVFNTDYENMQIAFLIAGTLGDTKTRNAGQARIRGGEIEATLAIGPGLIVAAEYSYLDARVLEVFDIDGENVAGQYKFASAPRHSGVLSLDASLLTGAWGELRGFLSYSYTDRRNGGGLPGRFDLSHLPAYDLLNARLSLIDLPLGDGALSFSAFGRNLLDEEYLVMAVPSLPHTDRAVLWGMPRSFGAELSYQW